ncbi:hypothetical protein FNH22_00405 [Fulvivirga sp. M361]|uniref:hypothetical protein n=1 Tax=Fulvivirga sp. M361 TaxID=2594266 RepID=UPI0011798BA4|nr:hypothetical protein [Fulvivirga sp. M361]TRX62591.1 hypothetical protein FNH22_00405 [Fulvivirga sp. M361]
MKKILSLLLITFSAGHVFGQTHGITYQAVVIDENAQEIPGIDIQGNVLPNHPLTVRFTILNESGEIDYQEDHATETDKYGMIYLAIGSGVLTAQSPDIFREISWDGTAKSLEVEISLGETPGEFIEFSEQELYFVPYAFHRNITATGTLMVEDSTTLNNVLTVNAPSILHGETTINDTLEVNASSFMNGEVFINDVLEVNAPGFMNGEVTINDVLEVNAPGFINGQVTISAEVGGGQDQYNAYPLQVEGSNQGIAIRVNGSRDAENNFISFWDEQDMQGRIEGQTSSDLIREPEYIYDKALFGARTLLQVANTGIAVGAAAIDPGNAAIEAANALALTAEITAYEFFARSNLGVTYESSSGDYAEWLPRLDPEERIEAGQVVGVFGGKITKVTEGAEQVMVVSKKPIVLGNMPPAGIDKDQCEMVGFMGQVQVWVMGKVQKGDYIVSYASGSGFGKAVAPEELTLEVLDKIVGRSWAGSDHDGVNLINTVIGVETNQLIPIVGIQQKKITALEQEIVRLKKETDHERNVLMTLVPGYKEALESQAVKQEMESRTIPEEKEAVQKMETPPAFTKSYVAPQEITKEQVLEIFQQVEQRLKAQGIETETSPILQKIKNDPDYLKKTIDGIMKMFENTPVGGSPNTVR